MSSFAKGLLSYTAAVAILFGACAFLQAQDAKVAKGSIEGTVLDKDGKPVEGVEVRLIPAGRRDPSSRPATRQGATTQRGQRPAIASARTDKDGKFALSDVLVGDYRFNVRDDEKKVYGRAPGTVEEGKTANVEIKCTDQPRQRGGETGGARKTQ